MRNQPKYHFFKNTHYALAGLRDVLKNETSFKVEFAIFLILQIVVFFLPLPLIAKILLSGSLFAPLIVEILNSAIERAVDLVTLEEHELAKRAKDAGSAAVFVSLVFAFVVWFFVFYGYFKGLL